MKGWIIVSTFTSPIDAHLAKTLLEAQGITVELADEQIVQSYQALSQAVGGIKLSVQQSDFLKAKQILIKAGYVQLEPQQDNAFLAWFEKITNKIPYINRLGLETKLVGSIVLVLIVGATFIFWLLIPSKLEQLINNKWCVDKLYYKGQAYTPHSIGLKLVFPGANCSETMSFNEDGTVNFPGFNSFEERCNWRFDNDSLYITKWEKDKSNHPYDDKHIKESEKNEKSIFPGIYSLEINDNIIVIQSKDLKIIGRVYKDKFKIGL